MAIDIKQKHQLRKLIRQLRSFRGRHTELVTVYVPSGYDLNKIIQHLQQEQGTATNIKDARTRKNVIDSLEKAVRHLRLYKKTPDNGLAIFSGNISDQEGKIDIQVFWVEPPEPLLTRMYRCDQRFILEPLESMVEHKEVYGLIVMDRREANLGLLKGTYILPVATLTSGVPGKYKTGGQSAARFARIREGMAKEFYKRIAEEAKKEFLQLKELKGIILGGPGPTKYEFNDGDYLITDLKKKVIGIKDITYTDESGLNELVEKGKDLLEKEAITKEKKLMERFLEALGKSSKVTYGFDDVKKALEANAVELLLVSESIEEKKMDDLEDLSAKSGCEMEIISIDTREGQQLRDLGGVGALLRYDFR